MEIQDSSIERGISAFVFMKTKTRIRGSGLDSDKVALVTEFAVDLYESEAAQQCSADSCILLRQADNDRDFSISLFYKIQYFIHQPSAHTTTPIERIDKVCQKTQILAGLRRLDEVKESNANQVAVRPRYEPEPWIRCIWILSFHRFSYKTDKEAVELTELELASTGDRDMVAHRAVCIRWVFMMFDRQGYNSSESYYRVQAR